MHPWKKRRKNVILSEDLSIYVFWVLCLSEILYNCKHLLGAQSMYSMSSRAAPPLRSLERIPSKITSKFLSFLRGTTTRFQWFPLCPVLFHISIMLFSVCAGQMTKDTPCGSISHFALVIITRGFKALAAITDRNSSFKLQVMSPENRAEEKWNKSMFCWQVDDLLKCH